MNRSIVNLPNSITGVRFFLSLGVAVLLTLEQTQTIAFWAWALFAGAAVSDWIDGYVARRYGSVTIFGKLMDPLADKILVTTALIMLIPTGRLPAWVALVILCREIMVTGLRGMASSSGIVVAASNLGKIKSTAQYLGLGLLIFPLDLLPLPWLHQAGLAITYLAMGITVWSGCDYFYQLRKIFLSDQAA